MFHLPMFEKRDGFFNIVFYNNCTFKDMEIEKMTHILAIVKSHLLVYTLLISSCLQKQFVANESMLIP
jgi:hypothetical protein